MMLTPTGQPQAPTDQAPPTTPEATSIVGAPVTQISDGQIQAPTSTPEAASSAPLVSQITDGQPQAPVATGGGNYSSPNATAPVEFPGVAATSKAAVGALAAGLFAMVAML